MTTPSRVLGLWLLPLLAACSSAELLEAPLEPAALSAAALPDRVLALRGFTQPVAVPVRAGVFSGPQFGFGFGSFGPHGGWMWGMAPSSGLYAELSLGDDASARAAFRREIENAGFAARVIELEGVGAAPADVQFLLDGVVSFDESWHGWSYGTFIPYLLTCFVPVVLGAPLTLDESVTISVRVYDAGERYLGDFSARAEARYWQSLYRDGAPALARRLAFEQAARGVLVDFSRAVRDGALTPRELPRAPVESPDPAQEPR